jgi:hypothetical protein
VYDNTRCDAYGAIHQETGNKVKVQLAYTRSIAPHTQRSADVGSRLPCKETPAIPNPYVSFPSTYQTSLS